MSKVGLLRQWIVLPEAVYSFFVEFLSAPSDLPQTLSLLQLQQLGSSSSHNVQVSILSKTWISHFQSVNPFNLTHAETWAFNKAWACKFNYLNSSPQSAHYFLHFSVSQAKNRLNISNISASLCLESISCPFYTDDVCLWGEPVQHRSVLSVIS